MSRLVSLLIVLLAIAVATPVLAEQRLTLSGEMRVRGYSIVSETLTDANDNVTNSWEKSSATSSRFFDQRLRLIGRIAVAEGVNVHFLSDLNNGQWDGPADVNQGPTRGWLNVDVGQVNMRVGKFYYGIANQIALDIVNTGAVFTLKGAVPVEFAYFKHNERSIYEDDDTDIYTLNVKHSTDMYSANVFGGFWRDGRADVTKVYLVGAQSNFNLDPVKLNVELNYFHGDNGASGADKRDIRGMQAFLDAGVAVADNVTVGARGYYARGYSNKADTNQIRTFADNAGNWQPESYGSMNTEFNTFASGGNSRIFDVSGQGAGVRGAQVYGTVKIMDPLTGHASVGYARPDKRVDMKSVYWANVSGTYTLAARTNLDGVVSYAKPSFRDSATEDDARIVAGMRLRVNF